MDTKTEHVTHDSSTDPSSSIAFGASSIQKDSVTLMTSIVVQSAPAKNDKISNGSNKLDGKLSQKGRE